MVLSYDLMVGMVISHYLPVLSGDKPISFRAICGHQPISSVICADQPLLCGSQLLLKINTICGSCIFIEVSVIDY